MAALVREAKFAELNELEMLHIASTGKLSQAEKVAVLEAAAKEYKSVVAYNNLGPKAKHLSSMHWGKSTPGILNHAVYIFPWMLWIGS